MIDVAREFRGACLLLFLLPVWASAQTAGRSVLCRAGSGTFDAEFRTGVKTHVGAAREGGGAGLAERVCSARLSWENQETMVAASAAEVDLDAFGVDFGDGVPAAAFQIRKSDSDCCGEYRIYSLEKPPRLLRTITGSESFRASDVDLDGRVEIWADDGAAVSGLESLSLGELNSPPTVVFRVARGRLTDVSAEFQDYFDRAINEAKQGIGGADLEEFKASDGKLAETLTADSAARLHRLRAVKARVLEVVCGYLYSGREAEAWRALGEMWPAADVERIRSAIAERRARGIHSQAEETSESRTGKKNRARIFDAVTRSGASHTTEVVPPQPILLEFTPTPGTESQGQELLDLVIDAAGKVSSVEETGKLKRIAPQKVAAALTWKFIPAFKDGKPVASRLRIWVSPKQ